MAPQKPNFAVYIDPTAAIGVENGALSPPRSPPSKKIHIEVPKMDTIQWLREPLREVNQGFARPTDPAWTLARLPEKKVTLGNLRKWQKSQPNDHTSKCILPSLLYILTIIEPWPKDESTAAANIDALLLRPDQTPENIEGKTVEDLLQLIPDYEPIYIQERPGKPRNIDLQRKWTPLGLFLLFWTPEILQEVCNQTNSYGYRCQFSEKRPWKPITKIELLHFLGTCFLLGLYKQPPRKYVYSQENGCLSGVPLSKNRREDILKMIHFLDRGEGPHPRLPYWFKFGKVYSYLRGKSQFYWEPGSRLTVDEVMIRFEGRSSGITTIPGKPVPTGFKYFALADDGYIYNFECTAPGVLEGDSTEDINSRVISIPEKGIYTKLSNTQAVVERLMSILYPRITSTNGYHLYLDNLFVSWKLCYLFKQRGIAVTGTCRKGACGYPPRLSGFKTINCALKWGALQAEVVEGVFAFLWQDNNAVQVSINLLSISLSLYIDIYILIYL